MLITAEPTPAEEAAARAKEASEQATLPYKWTQTIGDVDLSFTVPGNLKSRDLVVEFKKLSLVAGVKGQDPVIKVLANTRSSPCATSRFLTCPLLG